MAFRLPPAMAVGSYKTYRIAQPKTAQTRVGSCEAADCPHYSHGWRSVVDETTDLGKARAYYIRRESGRRYTEYGEPHGITVFTFEAGQQCFEQHHVLDRPQFYLVRDGDHRGNPTGRTLTHSSPVAWRDDFGEHQARLAEQIERG